MMIKTGTTVGSVARSCDSKQRPAAPVVVSTDAVTIEVRDP